MLFGMLNTKVAPLPSALLKGGFFHHEPQPIF
jgi:hypothetical protein